VETLKNDLETFFLSVREFRNGFRRDAPFAFAGPSDQAYLEMDKQVRGVRMLICVCMSVCARHRGKPRAAVWWVCWVGL
jgi:hypothetical protein